MVGRDVSRCELMNSMTSLSMEVVRTYVPMNQRLALSCYGRPVVVHNVASDLTFSRVQRHRPRLDTVLHVLPLNKLLCQTDNTVIHESTYNATDLLLAAINTYFQLLTHHKLNTTDSSINTAHAAHITTHSHTLAHTAHTHTFTQPKTQKVTKTHGNIPLLIIGILLTSLSPSQNSLANSSSKYPRSTALNLDPAASSSVC